MAGAAVVVVVVLSGVGCAAEAMMFCCGLADTNAMITTPMDEKRKKLKNALNSKYGDIWFAVLTNHKSEDQPHLKHN